MDEVLRTKLDNVITYMEMIQDYQDYMFKAYRTDKMEHQESFLTREFDIDYNKVELLNHNVIDALRDINKGVSNND